MSLLSVPPPEVVQKAGSTITLVCEARSSEPTVEIRWDHKNSEGLRQPVKSSSRAVQTLPFVINSTSYIWENILLTRVTSTLTIKQLDTAYGGVYYCTAVAGSMKMESDGCQVWVQVRMGVRCGASDLKRDTTMVCYTVQHLHAEMVYMYSYSTSQVPL